jgi:hypothetical protein
MRELYARVVLWLIRPAVQRALREEMQQGSLQGHYLVPRYR